MIGYLIYDTEGYNRNEWFVGELISYAKKHHIELKLIIVDRHEAFSCEKLPDFAIVRVIAPHINEYFESCGIPVFNNYRTSYIANSKWNTFDLGKKLDIPVMQTYLPSEYTFEKLPLPVVIKSLDGHGGSEVFLAKTEDEFRSISKKMIENNYLIQECCSDPGKDVRVYCLGDKIVLAVLRESKTDFRSNFSLGGTATVFTPTDSMLQTIKILRDELRFTLVGIDFIYHNGSWVLNEIEDVVGTRMIYKCTDIDIVELYISHIVNSLSQ